jgi:hypothetical protein
VDDGGVVGGQALVVADGAPAAGDPVQCLLDNPPARQHLEGVQFIGPPDNHDGDLSEAVSPPPSAGTHGSGVAQRVGRHQSQ